MLSKNAVKDIQSLYHKKHRDEAQLFIAEGPKLATELLTQIFLIQQVYATATWLKSHRDIDVPVIEVSEAELSRISNLETPNEVLIIAHKKAINNEYPFKAGDLSLVLDGIQDPGNLGTIIRTADWFGIQEVVCSTDTADIYNPKVVQATMGSLLRINCRYTELSDVEIPDTFPVLGAMLHGKNLYEITQIRGGLVVIGNESKGIREPFLSRISQPITIPRYGEAESLNAAVATGIILAHLTSTRL